MSGIDIISDTTGQAIVESIKALGTKVPLVKFMLAGVMPTASAKYLTLVFGLLSALLM